MAQAPLGVSTGAFAPFSSPADLLGMLGSMGQRAASRVQSSLGFSGVPQCRCMPSDACWPKQPQWDAFNHTLGGKLIATIPIGSVCDAANAFGAYDPEACAQLRADWYAPELHSDHPSSIMAPFAANQSCDPFAADGVPCVRGAYIQYAVNATDASDFKKTLDFVRSNNIRLTIRNTGHDFYGKTTGAGAVGIWTHHMKSIQFLDYDSPIWKGKAIKAGAGVQLIEAYTAANKEGLAVVGGDCDGVGYAGGYSQGGGQGPFASKRGLGSDQVLEWEVVTANGDLITATPTQNADLYWALSGGGGGTYGVVVSMTSKAYPDAPMSGASLVFGNSGASDDDDYYSGIEAFHRNLVPLVDAGAVALWVASSKGFKLAPIMAPEISETHLRSLMAPVLASLDSLDLKYKFDVREFPTFLDAYKSMNSPTNTYNLQIGGRLIPRSLVLNDNPALTRAFRNIHSKGGLVSGFALNATRKSASYADNSVNPIWRDTLFDLVLGTIWNDTNWDKNMANQGLVTNQLLPEIERITPGGAAYLNEGDPNQKDWQQVFYGKNYKKLRAVKKKYDPEDLFYALTAVGSEVWAPQPDGRLCRA